MYFSSCQRAVRRGRICPYLVIVVQELEPPDVQKRVPCPLWLQTLVAQNPNIMDTRWFSEEAWLHLSEDVSRDMHMWSAPNLHVIREGLPIHMKWHCGVPYHVPA